MEMAQAGAIKTVSQAIAALGMGPSGDALLKSGQPDPAPPSDGKQVYETARRFI